MSYGNRTNKDRVLGAVTETGSMGLTDYEARRATDLHHGQTSAALSILHKEGKIARLYTKRGDYSVYVLANRVDGRGTIARR